MNKNNQKYWELESDAVLKELETGRQGLTAEEAERRLKKYGPNKITSQKKRTAPIIFISQFKNPLALILVVASLVSGFLGEIVSMVIIIVMIVFSAVISFIQEYRSEKTMELLKKRLALKATVMRDGKKIIIPAGKLTPGDIVSVGYGQVVPADLRLIEINDLALNEAVLTGESFPAEKSARPQTGRDFLPQAMSNLAFMGTHVAQGSGTGVVIAVGQQTEFGRTAKMLSAKEGRSEFQKGVSDFGIFLFKIIVAFSLLVFIFLALLKGNWLESLLFSLAIAVGISPELLPMIVSINLSRAARLLAKRGILVKKLMAIEDLGNADVLCTDKTGTLTEGRITLKKYFDFSGRENDEIINLARLCSDAIVKANHHLNPLDRAVADYIREHGIKTAEEYGIIDEIAFDFQRRRMSVIVQNEKRLLIAKGAAEELLDVCSDMEIDGRREDISRHLESIKTTVKEQESNGFKTILLAYKEIEDKDVYTVKDENNLILAGYLVFSDPPKKDAAESLTIFRKMGVKIKLLTGDTAESAKWLAKETGFVSNDVILGSDLDRMDNIGIKRAVEEFDIFAKVTPEHKIRIVKALKEAGHTVSFLGDGVNDAPALRAADAGISVDEATDVAKEAADIILLKKSLPVLINGIKEGRRTFGNTLKYIFCTISSNYGNMFSVVGASLILPFIPLLPVQVLLLNFVSDFPLLAVATDSVDEEYLRKPKHWDIKTIRKFMNYFGLASSAFDFLTYGFLLLIVHASMPLFQVGWFWQSFITEVLLIFVVRTRKWFWQSRPSKTLMTAFFLTILIVLAIMYTPLAGYFGFATMPLWVNLCLVAMGCGYFFAVELGKKAFYKKYDI